MSSTHFTKPLYGCPPTLRLLPPPRPIARFLNLTGFPYFHDKPLPPLPPLYKRGCESTPVELHSQSQDCNKHVIIRKPVANELDSTPISAVAAPPILETIHELDSTPSRVKPHAENARVIFEMDGDSPTLGRDVHELDGSNPDIVSVLSNTDEVEYEALNKWLRYSLRFSTGTSNIPWSLPTLTSSTPTTQDSTSSSDGVSSASATTSESRSDSDSDSNTNFEAICSTKYLSQEMSPIKVPLSAIGVTPGPPNTPAAFHPGFSVPNTPKTPLPNPIPMVLLPGSGKDKPTVTPRIPILRSHAEVEAVKLRRKARYLTWGGVESKNWDWEALLDMSEAKSF